MKKDKKYKPKPKPTKPKHKSKAKLASHFFDKNKLFNKQMMTIAGNVIPIILTMLVLVKLNFNYQRMLINNTS